MFEDLRDAVSFLWSWSWPTAAAETMEVFITPAQDKGDVPHLFVSYKFSIGDDGPYTGYSEWTPSSRRAAKNIGQVARNVRHAKTILVRYRPDDPSVNRVDKGAWR